MRGPLPVPIAMGRNERLVERPRHERVVAERTDEFPAVHGHIAGARRDRSGLVAMDPPKAVWVVAADTVDDLPNLIQIQPPGGARMIDSLKGAGQHYLAHPTQTIAIRGCADLVEVERGRVTS